MSVKINPMVLHTENVVLHTENANQFFFPLEYTDGIISSVIDSGIWSNFIPNPL